MRRQAAATSLWVRATATAGLALLSNCCPTNNVVRYPALAPPIRFNVIRKPVSVVWKARNSLSTHKNVDCDLSGEFAFGLVPVIYDALVRDLAEQGLTLTRFDVVDANVEGSLSSIMEPGVVSAALDMRAERGLLFVSKVNSARDMKPRPGTYDRMDASYYCIYVNDFANSTELVIDLFKGIL